MTDFTNIILFILDVYGNSIRSFKPQNLEITINRTSYNELSFDIPYYCINDVSKVKLINPVYAYMEVSRVLYGSGLGHFQITSIEIESDGILEQKHVECCSLEYELSKKYINELKVRIDGQNSNMVLYTKNVQNSLMHKILENTDWTVGYCSSALAETPVVLDLDRTSKYDIITSELYSFLNASPSAQGCDIEFDADKKQVNLYSKGENLKETGVTLTFDNLMQNAEVSYKEENMKNTLRVKGDGISIREVNGGSDTLTDLRYYATDQWMGSTLAEKYKQYYNCLYGPDHAILSYYAEIYRYLTLFELRQQALEYNMPSDVLHPFQKLSFNRQQAISNYRHASAVRIANSDCENITFWADSGIDYGRQFLLKGIELLDQKIAAENQKYESDDDPKEGLKFYYEQTKLNYQYQVDANYVAGAQNRCYTELLKIGYVINALKKVLYKLSAFYLHSGYKNTHNSIFEDGDWHVDENGFRRFYDSPEFKEIVSRSNLATFRNIWRNKDSTQTYDIEWGDDIHYDFKEKNDKICTLINELYGDPDKPQIKYLQNEDITKIVDDWLNLTGDNYFSPKEIKALQNLEAEEEYIDANFKLLADDTNAKITEKSERLFANGIYQLESLNRPSLSFTGSIANPYMHKEFQSVLTNGTFNVGGIVNVVLRSDYQLTVSIDSISIDTEHPEDFSFTCSNIVHEKTPLDYNSYMKKLGRAYRNTLLYKGDSE